jgi:hypothetical protein
MKEIPMLRVSGVCQIHFTPIDYRTDSRSFLLQHHRRLFVINQKLRHMNEQNFEGLGAWWAQKMLRAQEKLTGAIEVLHTLNLDEEGLQLQWQAQRDSVTRKNPGKQAQPLIIT